MKIAYYGDRYYLVVFFPLMFDELV